MIAADVMTTKVIAVRDDATVREVAELLVTAGISAVPVIDSEGRLAGIVSEADLIRNAQIETEARRAGLLGILTAPAPFLAEFINAHAVKVTDVMTRDVVIATEETPLREIAARLETSGIKRVPIVRDGELVGIVSRANLLRAFAAMPDSPMDASDSAVRHAISTRITEMAAGSPWLISVTVQDGVAELWGAVGSELHKKAIAVAAEGTPGVKSVIDHTYVAPVVRAA
jgi:CBS-domain-containing membrane protein